MSQGFDPYHKWLGIPPEEQPANHYRLLGVREFEDDPDVLESAADQRMAHLRSFQAGKNAALSQKLLNEVSTARVCLLNPDQKQAYDNQLRASTAADSLSQQAVTPAPLNLPTMPTRPLPMSPPPQPAPQMAPAPVQINSQTQRGRKALWKNPAVIGLAVTGVLGLALVLVIRSAITGGKPETSITQQTTDTQPTPVPDNPPAPSIKIDPVKRDEPSSDPKPPVEPVPKPEPPKPVDPTPVTTVDRPWIDLIELVEPENHTEAGKWVKSEESVKTIGENGFAFEVPVKIEGSYEVDFGFTRNDKDYALGVIIPVGKYHGRLVLSLLGGGSHGLEQIDGKSADSNVTRKLPGTIVNGRHYKVRVIVHVNGEEASIKSFLDNRLLFEWQGKHSSLSIRSAIEWPKAGSPSFYAYSDTTIHYARLRMISGEMIVIHPSPPKKKHPLPSDDRQNTILAQIEEVYDISAAKTPGQKLKLAGDLLALGKKAENDPNEKFVLLRNAMELARAGGDAALMLRAIDEIGNDFEIEASDVQQTMLIGFARDAKQESSIGSLARVYDDYVATAIAQQRYDDALKVATAVNAAAQRRAGSKFRKAIYDRRKEVAKLHDDWKTIQDARVALKADPDDAEANLTLGRWYCFEKRQWQQGFSHLAKASDTKLQTLAQRELDSPPADANAQVALADAWYEAANGADENIKSGLLARAGHWYLQAQKDITSAVVKSKIEKQLKEIGKVVKLSSDVTAVTLKLRATLMGHTLQVRRVDFSPDGKTLVTGSSDSTVRLWDVATGNIQQVLSESTQGIYGVRFSPDGKTLAAANLDNTILLWKEGAQTPMVLKGHSEKVLCVAFSPDGKTLASAGYDSTVKLWDVRTGKQLKSFTDTGKRLPYVSFSADGKTLLTTNYDSETVKHWDIATGKVLLAIKTGGQDLMAVFDPSQRHIISVGSTNVIKFWDAINGRLVRTLAGHSYAVFSVCFSPDGRLMASASNDGTIRIWDLTTYKELTSIVAHADAYVFDIAFSPDGKTLASVSADKTVKLWDIEFKPLKPNGSDPPTTLSSANDQPDIGSNPGESLTSREIKKLRPGLVVMHFAKQASQQGQGEVYYVKPSELGDPVGPAKLTAMITPWRFDQNSNAAAIGYLKIPQTGKYTFKSYNFYDRNALLIDGKMICGYRDRGMKNTTLELQEGFVKIASIGYFASRGSVEVTWQPPGTDKLIPIAPRFLFYLPSK